jgi:hypothetical protein
VTVRPSHALALVVAMAAGCGGDDAAERYRREANAICREAQRAARDVPAPGTAKGLADALENALAKARRLDRRLDRLDPPEELEADHRANLGDSRRGRRLFEQLVAELRSADGEAAGGEILKRRLPALARLIERGNARARRMGIEDCVADELAPPGA